MYHCYWLIRILLYKAEYILYINFITYLLSECGKEAEDLRSCDGENKSALKVVCSFPDQQI